MREPKVKTPIDVIAFLVSAIFSPYITALVFIIIVIYNSTRDINEFLPWMITFLLFAIIFPGFYVLWQVEQEKISDLHMSDQNERKLPFIIVAVSSVIGTILLVILDAARPVVTMAVTYSVNAVAAAIITQYWKISIHMVLFASVATVAIILYGPSLWWIYLILIPLGWSRIHRKRHTPMQVIAGTLLAFVLTSAVFLIFGYL